MNSVPASCLVALARSPRGCIRERDSSSSSLGADDFKISEVIALRFLKAGQDISHEQKFMEQNTA